MNRSVVMFLLTIAIALGWVPVCLLASTINVRKDGSGQFTTLQPAVDAAASGDTILIGPGWYGELHWVDHFGSPIEVAAYWTDDRNLTFIGSSVGEVTIGPVSYSQFRDGPQGIFHEDRSFGNSVVVRNLSLANLYIGIQGQEVDIESCHFQSGAIGVIGIEAISSRVSNSVFLDLNTSSCAFYNCDSVEVSQCTLGAKVYFGSTEYGAVRECSADGRSLASFYLSGGVIEDNIAICTLDPVVSVNESNGVIIRRNYLGGGIIGVSLLGENAHAELENNTIETPELAVVQLAGGATLVAHQNVFIKPYGLASFLVRTVSYPGSGTPTVIDMENNYWAQEYLGGYTSATVIAGAILDHNDDPSLNVIIDFEPFLGAPVPTEALSWGSVKSMFR